MIKNRYEHLKILVVEDEAFTRDIVCGLLYEIGIRSVTTAENGQAALMEMIRTQPDIVFCDVHMDKMDGKQFLATVRKTAVRDVGRTPIVFLTGDSQAATVMFAKQQGVSGYLVKPVSLAQLRDRIDVILGFNGPSAT